MPELTELKSVITSGVFEELESARKQVQENIRNAYRINEYMRGVADTLHTEKESEGASLWGWTYFENVEKGIPPLIQFAPLRNMGVKQKIYDWSIAKGISFESDSKRRSFAYLLRRKILFEGTKMYRSGGRNDIYTPIFNKAIENIENKVVNAIINTNILK